MMSILPARRAARQRRRPRVRRIRFREAFPVRGDRRDLRRLLRRAARAAMIDRKAEMTARLERLCADHVPLSEVLAGPRPRDGIVTFLDGTRLLLLTRLGSREVSRLREDQDAAVMWLIRVQPSFSCCWFRLWFAGAGAAQPAEVLAKVGPAPG
jgi:hypothetical protein